MLDQKEKDRLKVGDRIWCKVAGYGTVAVAPYYTMESTVWVCVKYDDYLDQVHPLCGESKELIKVTD